MYTRIVDGSAVSDRAMREAAQLAREGHARMRLVHVEDVCPPASTELYVDYDSYRQACLADGRQVLDHATATLRQLGIAPEPTLIAIETSHVGDSIVQEARAWGADLLVLGTHGRGGLRHLLLGSVAEGVVRQAPVPVLLVRGPGAADPHPQATPEAGRAR
jgi:nucleotide-binding universal stress UspA family protein